MMELEKNRVFSIPDISKLHSEAMMLLDTGDKVCTEWDDAAFQLRSLMGQTTRKSALLDGLLDKVKNPLVEKDILRERELNNVTLTNIMMCIPPQDTASSDAVSLMTNNMTMIKGIIEDLTQCIEPIKEPQTFLEYFAVVVKAANKKENDTLMQLNYVVCEKRLLGMPVYVTYAADPVNMSTGNFVYQYTDLTARGENPLAFTRTYNGMSRSKGILGRGWVHNYEKRIEKQEDTLTLFHEDGREEELLLLKTGTYSNKNATFIVEETETGYHFKEKNRVKEVYDKEGKLKKRVDDAGEETILSYEEDRLIKVSRRNGEFLNLQYNEGEQLIGITDHTGRQVSYGYKGKKLVSVTDPEGNSFRYGYGENGRIENITDKSGVRIVSNEYDEFRRIAKQTFPDGGKLNIEYLDKKDAVRLTEQNGNSITYYHDKAYRDKKICYEDGYEEWDYDEKGYKKYYRDKNGNETFYIHDKQGNLIEETNALGGKKKTGYNYIGKPISITYPDETEEHFTYDEEGRLVGIYNRMGEEISLFYGHEEYKPSLILMPDKSALHLTHDKKGNITSIKYPDNTGSTYIYDELNRVIASTDGEGRTTRFSYDGMDRITSIVRADGAKQSFSYNPMGEAVRIEDFDGYVMAWEYNVLNKPSLYRDKQGRETTMEYDLMWNLSRVTDAEGGSVTYEYDGLNRLKSVTDALERRISFAYDPKGNRTKVRYPDRTEVAYEYDALDRCIKETDRAGRITQKTYDIMGNVTCITDNAGNKTLYEYDALGRKVKETDREGGVTRYTYTSYQKKDTVTYPNGRVERYHYAPGGRLIKLEKGDGTWEAYDHDKAGNMIRCSHSDGREYTYAYDCLNRLIELQLNDKVEKRYTYDAMGNVTSMEDAAGNVTTYDYSPTGKLLRVTDPTGNRVLYSYNGRDELIGILQLEKGEKLTFLEVKGDDERLFTDSDWNKVIEHNRENKDLHLTQFTRDAGGQITCITDALGREDNYTYDVMGRVIERVDNNGDTTYRSYHPDGQVKEIHYPSGKKVSYSYDALARLQELQDWLGRTTFTYDREDRLTKVVDHTGDTTTYDWNPDGTMQKLCYPNGKEVLYGYDAVGRLLKIESEAFRMSYDYDDMGRVSYLERGNGVHTLYKYDDLGLLTVLTHGDKEGILEAFTCEYDSLGNKTKVARQSRDEACSYIHNYNYDALGRLVKVEEKGQVVAEYQYDGYGNRTRLVEYKNGEHFLEAPVIRELTYNGMNQLLGDEGATYSYDNKGCLTAIQGSSSLVEPLSDVRMSYDENGLLTNICQGEELLQENRYNGLACRIGSVFQKGNRKVRYGINYADPYKRILVEKTSEEAERNYLWQDNSLVGMPEEGSYVLTDMFHTPVSITDRNGAVQGSYRYDVFGKLQGKGEQSSLPFGYSGYVKESVENLYFTGSRAYNAVDGRFQSKDLYRYMDYKNPASMNLYSFVQGNPLKYFDFDGHISIEEKSYWDRTIEMVTLGDYSDEVTALGMAINIGAGLLGIDVVADIRDLSAHLTVNRDLDSWAWWGTLGVYILAFVPGLGAVKNVLKGSEVLKYSDEAVGFVADTGKVPKAFAFLDDANDLTKTLDKVEVGNVNSYDDTVSGMFGGVDLAEGIVNVADEGIGSVNDIIHGVESGDISLINNIQKGNYGEMKMDIYFESQGYQRISIDWVTGLNDATHHGIDGVYYKADGHPPYVIAEAKYGSSKLSMTRDGLQMSDDWINGSDRLVNSVGKDMADDILLTGYGKQLVRTLPDGTITVTILE